MSETKEPTFPLHLTATQRRVIAKLWPDLTPQLRLDCAKGRTMQLSLQEIQEIARVCRAALPRAATGMERNSLYLAVTAAQQALENFGEGNIHRIPVGQRLYQFTITLTGIRPPIWRRIPVKDCSLDKLHEHIQTAMGWTNSHLYQFMSDGVPYGDYRIRAPAVVDENAVIHHACSDTTP